MTIAWVKRSAADRFSLQKSAPSFDSIEKVTNNAFDFECKPTCGTFLSSRAEGWISCPFFTSENYRNDVIEILYLFVNLTAHSRALREDFGESGCIEALMKLLNLLRSQFDKKLYVSTLLEIFYFLILSVLYRKKQVIQSKNTLGVVKICYTC